MPPAHSFFKKKSILKNAESAVTYSLPLTKMGGAPGAGSLLLNTKASQVAACSRAPVAIVPGQQPESHLAETGAAEGHAWHADSPGSSENAGIGSHLAATGFSNGQEAVL